MGGIIHTTRVNLQETGTPAVAGDNGVFQLVGLPVVVTLGRMLLLCGVYLAFRVRKRARA